VTEASNPPPKKRSLLHSPYFWATLAGLIFIPLLRPLLRHVPNPPPVIGQVPAFSLTDTRGEPFGSSELEGQVYVANFIFTRCASICPLLTRSMGQLQERYDATGVDGIRLVSITVDPEYDTPDRLREYAAAHGADPRRWEFLTGPEPQIRELVERGFKTAMGVPESANGLIDVAHSGKFVLVDGDGGIRGYYGTDEMGLDEIYHRSRHVLEQRR